MESATWMPLTVAAVVVVATVVVSAIVTVVALRGRRRLEHALRDSRTDVDALRARVEELSTRMPDRSTSTSSPDAREFVITSLPDSSVAATLATREDEEPATQPLSAGQFASVALGESLVRLLSFGYGVGHALSPENRNRIRFAMRQEVRRARRQRRRDVKEARRHLRAQQAEGEGADLTSDADAA
jgi:hypothetical protein